MSHFTRKIPPDLTRLLITLLSKCTVYQNATAKTDKVTWLTSQHCVTSQDTDIWIFASDTPGLVAKKLCVVATSVPSERIFSKNAQNISEKRSCLKPAKVRSLVFLNANAQGQEGQVEETIKYGTAFCYCSIKT